MATSQQRNIKRAKRPTERTKPIQKAEENGFQAGAEIPRIREHLVRESAGQAAGPGAQIPENNSTTLLHTMFHLLDSIEMWLEVAAQQKPGFDGGRHRGDPRRSVSSSMTHQFPPVHGQRDTASPFSPTRTVFSTTASSIQGDRPRASEYERSLIDLRRTFGLAASSISDLVDENIARSAVGVSRQQTPTLPRVDEDGDPQPIVAPKVRRRRTMGTMPDTRPEPRAARPSAPPATPPATPLVSTPAQAQRRAAGSTRPPHPRRASAPPRSKTTARKEDSVRTASSRTATEREAAKPRAADNEEMSGKADYADLLSLVVHNWRQSLLLKFEAAKERYRVRAETPPVVHPEAERERQRLAEKPLPSLPASSQSSNIITSEPKQRARPTRRRPQSAYV